jgi:hypothetical protein
MENTAGLAAQDYSRRFSREIKRYVIDGMVFGLIPAVATPLFSHWVFAKPEELKSIAVSAIVVYGATIVLYSVVQAGRLATVLLKERTAELQELRTFKAQVVASPLYIGPLDYCLKINDKRVSINLNVVRRAPVKIVHLNMIVSGKNGQAFSRDFTDPMRIANTSQIILNNILLQQEEVDRLDAEVFQIVGCATLENGAFYNFQFTSVPLR